MHWNGEEGVKKSCYAADGRSFSFIGKGRGCVTEGRTAGKKILGKAKEECAAMGKLLTFAQEFDRLIWNHMTAETNVLRDGARAEKERKMNPSKLIEEMNHPNREVRLQALRSYKALEKAGKVPKPELRENDANNHIHTIYSFSPYSPTKAAFCAYQAGLGTMGIMDHDSLSGAVEFLNACDILGTAGTVGFEFRCHFHLPELGSRRINNPDQNDHSYIAVHGVPHQNIEKLNAFLAPYRAHRNARNRRMVEKINVRFKKFGIALDFDRDVLPISMASEGGSVTERHLMYALSIKITDRFGKGQGTVDFLDQELKMPLSEKIRGYLQDAENPHYLYDLLGVLKSDTSFFYLEAEEESCDISALVDAAGKAGAIVAYPYLGDVGGSVTGDKRPQKFEDEILEEVIAEVAAQGIRAVAYMPTRNTRAQLDRLRRICREKTFFEISGEDINSPRQKFECEALKDPAYANLIQSTWALIGHEKAATLDPEDGMFTEKTQKAFPDLQERIRHFAEIGRSC